MRKLCLAAALLLAVVSVGAQEPARPADAPMPSFEVASVRVNRGTEMGQFIRRQPGGSFSISNMPLRTIIQFAYQMRPFQVEGTPDWAASTRYGVAAKAGRDLPMTPPGTVSEDMLMLRSLLAERFKLEVRFETREMPIYELRLARNDGRLGPALSVTTTDCQALMKSVMGRGGPPPPPSPTERMQCGMRIGPGRMSAGSFPMSEFANTLAGLVQRTVVDRTGLTGNYDAELTFTMEQMPGPGGAPLVPPGGAAPPVDPNAPSIFTALQEQLGLKLESARGPVQMLIVERVEQATED
jgi:uncharacterized protein (TIGR03435 family)